MKEKNTFNQMSTRKAISLFSRMLLAGIFLGDECYLPRDLNSEKTEFKEISSRPNYKTGTETILLVEDEDDVRSSTARMLERQGYRVYQAREGVAAMEIVKERIDQIDMLVTDVIMPKMSGRELAKEVASHKENIKVLYISGYTDKTIISHGILDSDAAFLQKPYSVENISNKIREVLENGSFKQQIA